VRLNRRCISYCVVTMNHITLKSDGSVVHNEKTVETDLLVFLTYQVALEEGYALRSYFQMLEQYPLLVKLNAFFPTFLEKYHESPERGCTYPGLDCLELGKNIEMVGFPGKPRLEIYTTFMGIQGNEQTEIKSLQIESLLDVPVRLGRLKHVVFGDKVNIFEFETAFNLFEFIDGIAWALSFHGTPKHCELRR
jgi:hypothetical protein